MITKVVIVAPVHRYNDVRVFNKEAGSLVENGYKVVLFGRTSEGKDFKEAGVEVKGLAYSGRKERFLGLFKLFLLVLKEKGDVYHLHNPDTLFLLPFLKLFRKKVIYDTHENFPKKIMLRGWIPKYLRRLLALFVGILERLAGIVTDGLIVTQMSQLNLSSRAILIGNAPVKIVKNTVPIKESELRLVYLGGISLDRGLTKMISLINEINKKIPAKLWLIGPQINDSSIKDAMNEKSFEFVEYLGLLDQKVAFGWVEKAHFGLILLNDVADYKDTSPNKIFEYMMSGTPFVATSFPNWENQLEAVECGIFEKEGLEKLASSLIRIYEDPERYKRMCENALNYSQNEFNWSLVGEPELLGLYSEILKGLRQSAV